MKKLIFDRVIDALLTPRAGVITRKATLYVSPTYVVTASLRCKPDKRSKRTEIVLKIGVPNFVERQFVKACKKAGEPFPVKKIQLKFYPRKR